MKMENRYTEGIAFDGTAILDNGKPITIDEILKRLNEHDELVNKTNDIHDVSCCDCKKELEDAKGFIKDLQEELSYNSRI